MASALPDLPLKIWREILLRSSAESVFRFRAVCKGWLKVIDDPSFGRAHTFDHPSSSSHTTLVLKNSLGPPIDPLYTFDIDSLDFSTGSRHQSISASSHGLVGYESLSRYLGRFPVPACNGLILAHPHNLEDGPLEIWNPSTHEILQLPWLDFYSGGRFLLGLGYDHAAQDLKAVAVDKKRTRVYSLTSDTWRTIGGCLVDRGVDLWPEEQAGVFVDGALHWLLGDSHTILALDLATEEHRHIQLSALTPTKGNFFEKDIHVLGGCLAVSGFSVSHFNVWVMNGDESWTKLLSMKSLDLTSFGITSLKTVAYTKDKKQVLVKDGRRDDFFVFDIESDTIESRVYIEGLTGVSYAQNIPRSLFRLSDHCGARDRMMRLDPLQKRKLSFEIFTTFSPVRPLKKHKKNS